MTTHLSETVWKWGDEVSDYAIREIGEALRENKEFNEGERPDDPPCYTPGAYMIMSDADAMVYNIGYFLDGKATEGEVSLMDIDELSKTAPDQEAAKQIIYGVVDYLGYEFVP
jgi:hypothetical protein